MLVPRRGCSALACGRRNPDILLAPRAAARDAPPRARGRAWLLGWPAESRAAPRRVAPSPSSGRGPTPPPRDAFSARAARDLRSAGGLADSDELQAQAQPVRQAHTRAPGGARSAVGGWPGRLGRAAGVARLPVDARSSASHLRSSSCPAPAARVRRRHGGRARALPRVRAPSPLARRAWRARVVAAPVDLRPRPGASAAATCQPPTAALAPGPPPARRASTHALRRRAALLLLAQCSGPPVRARSHRPCSPPARLLRWRPSRDPPPAPSFPHAAVPLWRLRHTTSPKPAPAVPVGLRDCCARSGTAPPAVRPAARHLPWNVAATWRSCRRVASPNEPQASLRRLSPARATA